MITKHLDIWSNWHPHPQFNLLFFTPKEKKIWGPMLFNFQYRVNEIPVFLKFYIID